MVDAEVSGVMFTCNPVSGDPSMVAINASWGLGLAVVGGEVTPDDYLVSKVTREVVREHVNYKQVEYVPDAGGRGAVRVEVAPERRDVRCLSEQELGMLVEVAGAVERYFGPPGHRVGACARGAAARAPVDRAGTAGHGDTSATQAATGGCAVDGDEHVRSPPARRLI